MAIQKDHLWHIFNHSLSCIHTCDEVERMDIFLLEEYLDALRERSFQTVSTIEPSVRWKRSRFPFLRGLLE